MASPFISICIPTYQRAAQLKVLLDSIQEQTFRDFEIIINDNSPDDAVAQLVQTYHAILPIAYEKNTPAVSAVENVIKTIRRAKAEWIKVMHDDDWFAYPSALAVFVDAALHSGKDFIFSATNQVYLDTNKTEQEYLTPGRKAMLDDSVFSLFYLNLIGHPSAVLHRKDSSIGYDPSYNWVLDIDYYMRYLSVHPGYQYIPEPLVSIGKGEGQESYRYYKNGKIEIPEYFRLLASYGEGLLLGNRYVFHLVWNMLKRYGIRHVNAIRAFGYSGPLPAGIEGMISYQRKIPAIILKQRPWSEALMERCYKKMGRKEGLK